MVLDVSQLPTTPEPLRGPKCDSARETGSQAETKQWGCSSEQRYCDGGHSHDTEEASQSFVEREKKEKFKDSHLGVQDPICLLRTTDGQIRVVF